MMGMNVIFHLAAFVLISLLIYWLLLNLRQTKFLQDLLLSVTLKHHNYATRVYVDEPRKFLMKFAKAFGVPSQGDHWQPLPLRRIEPQPVVELHLRHGLRSIAFQPSEATSGPKPCLEFGLLSLPSEELRALVSSALGDDVVISYKTFSLSTHGESSC